jgi:putative oxidoreductase
MSPTLNSSGSVFLQGFATAAQGWAAAQRFVRTLFAPLLDLVIRLWLAQAFFVSAVLKIAHWDNALYLAEYEYPVSWMDPLSAAWLGAGIELCGSVLLAAGLATRFAAASMLALSIVIQLSYRELDTHLLWVALFAWTVVRGAGPLSLDHLLRNGLADTALPFARQVARLFDWISHHVTPLLQLGLRIWLATALLVAAELLMTEAGGWLPVSSVLALPPVLALSAALALIAGVGVRFVALLLLAATPAMTPVEPGLSLLWLFVHALFLAFGAGVWSLDTLIGRTLGQYFPQLEGKPAFSLEGLPQVVIIGAGFGGLACARALARTKVRITLIDRHNYHLFQPLLYQVATASLSPGDIATPVRGLLREQFNVRVLLGSVNGVDTRAKKVRVGELDVPYDYLVLATGASHSYFGRDDWSPFAPGLKRIEDATDIRRRMLTAFERAEASEDEAERRALLTFLIVGGGPTGVELAGAIAELARFGMEKDFRRFDPAAARVLLVQAAPRILPTFPEGLSASAQSALEKLGVEVLIGSRVEGIDGNGVTVNGQRIPARTVLWAAGVVASPAARWLGVEADNAGRIKVGADLSVPGLPEVYAVGDTALSSAWNGQPVPGLAPAAKQGGLYVARAIRARIGAAKRPPAFRYRHLGSLATIGRKAAVADFGFLRLSGAPAWWLWGLIHVGFLVGVRNRVSVMFDWFWAYLTFRSGTRLITGAPEPELRQSVRPRLEAVAG